MPVSDYLQELYDGAYKITKPFRTIVNNIGDVIDGQPIGTNDAYSYVSRYRQSPGFKLRFDKHNEYTKDKFGITYELGEETRPSVKYGSYSNYNPAIDQISYSPEQLKSHSDIGYFTAKQVLTHELGHDFLNDVKSNGNTFDAPTYAYSYPSLLNNSAFQKVKQKHFKKYDNPLALWLYVKMLKEKDQRMHDEDLDESYADFLKFREELDSLGIYDSMKANNPFTEEDLLKYQEINPNFRLFRYFTNEQIVLAMNELAQNNSPILTNYPMAKNGGVIYKQRFKY